MTFFVSTGYKHEHKNKKGQKAKSITSAEYKEVVEKTFIEGVKKVISRV